MTSLRKDVLTNAGANIVLAVLGVISGSLVSYRYGPEGRGLLGAAQVVAALAAALGSLGLGDALLYQLASRRAVPRPMLLSVAVAAALGGAMLGALFGALLAPHLDLGVSSAAFTGFCTVVSAAMALYTIPNGVLRGVGAFAPWNVLRLAVTLSWIVAIIGADAGGKVDLLVVGLVYTVLVSMLSAGGLFFGATRLAVREIRTPTPPTYRALLRFGLPAAFASAPLLLNARVDQVALAFSNPVATVGQYAAAAGYCWATVPLGQAIANLMSARVAAAANQEHRRVTLMSLTGLGVTVIGLSGIVAALAAPLALRILNGEGFEPAVTIARILLIGSTLQGITTLLEEGAKGLGHPRLPMIAELTGLAVMIALLAALAHRGAVPTAIASTLGYVASFLVITRGLSRLSSTPARLLLRPATIGSARTALRAAVPDEADGVSDDEAP